MGKPALPEALLPRLGLWNIPRPEQVQGNKSAMRKAMSIQVEEDFGAFIDEKVSEGRDSSRHL